MGYRLDVIVGAATTERGEHFWMKGTASLSGLRDGAARLGVHQQNGVNGHRGRWLTAMEEFVRG